MLERFQAERTFSLKDNGYDVLRLLWRPWWFIPVLYSLPCQQLLSTLGLPTLGWGASLLLSAGCAWLSRTYIERRALGQAV